MTLGLSKTARLGPSETRYSAYRKPDCAGNPQKSATNRLLSNDANRKESFGFLLTALPPVEKAGAALPIPALTIAALRSWPGGQS
jgi:hypothetical protein